MARWTQLRSTAIAAPLGQDCATTADADGEGVAVADGEAEVMVVADVLGVADEGGVEVGDADVDGFGGVLGPGVGWLVHPTSPSTTASRAARRTPVMRRG